MIYNLGRRGARKIPVKSIKEAVDCFIAERTAWENDGRRAADFWDGKITLDDGAVLTISWNGRVWNADGSLRNG